MDLDFRELFPQKVQNANLRLHIDPPPDIPPWRYEMVKALVGFDSNGILKMTPLPEHLATQQNWEDFVVRETAKVGRDIMLNRKIKTGRGRVMHNEMQVVLNSKQVEQRVKDSWDHYVAQNAVAIPQKNFTQEVVFPTADSYRCALTGSKGALEGLKLYPKFGPMTTHAGGMDNATWDPDERKWILKAGNNPIQGVPAPPWRSSNFDVPTTRIKTLFFIGKQAASEVDASSWFKDRQQFHVEKRDGNYVTAHANRVVGNASTGKCGVSHGYYQSHWQAEYPHIFAKRMGFDLVGRPTPTNRQDVKLYDTWPVYPGPRDFCGYGGYADTLYQYVLPTSLAPAKKSWKHETDNFGNIEFESSHQTTAASEYFWLDRTKWAEALAKEDLNFMPFVVRTTTIRTRPITYEFWTDPACTRMYSEKNPIFEWKARVPYDVGDNTDVQFILSDIVDMQHYRDAIQRFVTTGSDIEIWSLKQGKDAPFPMKVGESKQDYLDRMSNVSDPSFYQVMPNSGTQKDVEYNPAIADKIFETSDGHLSMAKRRSLYTESMLRAHPDAVRDYMNTFNPHKHSPLDLSELYHFGEVDVMADKYPDDDMLSNAANMRRIMTDPWGSGMQYTLGLASAGSMPELSPMTFVQQQLSTHAIGWVVSQVRAQMVAYMLKASTAGVAAGVAKLGVVKAIAALQSETRVGTMKKLLKIAVDSKAEDTLADDVGNLVHRAYADPTGIVGNIASKLASELAAFSKKAASEMWSAFKTRVGVNMQGSYYEAFKGYLSQRGEGEIVEGDWLRFGGESKTAQQALMGAPPSDKMINMKAFGAAQEDAREALATAEKEAKAMIQQAQVDLKQATRNFKLAKAGAGADEIQAGAVSSEMETALVVGETVDAAASMAGALLPTVLLVGVLLGFEVWEEHEANEKQKELNKRLYNQKLNERTDKIDAYFNASIPLNAIHQGGFKQSFMREKLKGTEVDITRDRTRTVRKGETRTTKSFNVTYKDLLRGLMENRYSFSMVDQKYVQDSAQRSMGHNLRTAEMIRCFKLIDFFTQDSAIYPANPTDAHSWTAGGEKPPWAGDFRPFPPQTGIPLTFVPDHMTPLPLKEYALEYTQAHNPSFQWTEQLLYRYYGAWVPSKVKRTSESRPSDTVEGLTIPGRTWYVYPVPVFVGFVRSRTGFVSSTDQMVAWPTVANRNGGRFDPNDKEPRPLVDAQFVDNTPLSTFLRAHPAEHQTVTNRGTAIGLIRTSDKTTALYRLKNVSNKEMCFMVFTMHQNNAALVFSSDLAPGGVYTFDSTHLHQMGDQFRCVMFISSAVPREDRNVVSLKPWKTWSDFYLLKAQSTIRSVYWDVYPSDFLTHTSFDVHLFANFEECRAILHLRSRMRTLQGKIQGEQAYRNLSQLFDYVEDHSFANASDDMSCEFASWIDSKIKVEEKVLQPRSTAEQRGLFFAVRYILSRPRTLKGGDLQWDKILSALNAGDEKYVLPGDEGFFDLMGSIKTPKKPITHIFAGDNVGRYVGRTLESADFDPAVFNESWQDWSRKLNLFPTESPLSPAAQSVLSLAADLHEHPGDKVRVWNEILPILNNKTTAHDLKPKSKHDREVYQAAEVVREYRVQVDHKVVSRIENAYLLAQLELTVAADEAWATKDAQNKDYEWSDIPTRFATALRNSLLARENPNWVYRSGEDLVNLDGETQLFAKMSEMAYKGVTERMNLVDPYYEQTFYYQHMHSTKQMAVYYCPSKFSTLEGPSLVVAFKGSKPVEEIVDAYQAGSQGTPNEAQTFRQLFQTIQRPGGDLRANLAVFIGEEGDEQVSSRFETAVRNTIKIWTRGFPGAKLYLTGHSLGGSLASYVLAHIDIDQSLVMKAVVFNPGMGLNRNYARMVESGMCSGSAHTNEMFGVLSKTPEVFEERQKKRLKTLQQRFDQGWKVLCSKLIVHKLGGPSESMWDDDPISLNAGGVSYRTYHYEGSTIPRNILCHPLRHFRKDAVLTRAASASDVHGNEVKGIITT